MPWLGSALVCEAAATAGVLVVLGTGASPPGVVGAVALVLLVTALVVPWRGRTVPSWALDAGRLGVRERMMSGPAGAEPPVGPPRVEPPGVEPPVGPSVGSSIEAPVEPLTGASVGPPAVAAPGPSGDTGRRMLAAVLPHLRVVDRPRRRDTPVGVVFDGAGWCVVLALHPQGHPHPGHDVLTSRRFPFRQVLPHLLGVLAEVDGELSCVQVVVHRVDEPSADHGEGCGIWVVLRIDAERSSSGGATTSAETVASLLSRATRRYARALAGRGWVVEPLRAQGVLSTLRGLCTAVTPSLLEPHPLGRAALEETWRTWRTDEGAQTGLDVRGGDADDLVTVLDDLDACGAQAVSVSGTLVLAGRPGAVEDGPEPVVAVRLAQSTRVLLEHVCEQLADSAPAGVHLDRTFGRHDDALRRTLPLGRHHRSSAVPD